MTTIRWADPPPHGNTGNMHNRMAKYQAVADELRANPERWAIIAEDLAAGSCGTLASRIRKGTGPFAPKGAFETRCSAPAGGRGQVYARYIGGES